MFECPRRSAGASRAAESERPTAIIINLKAPPCLSRGGVLALMVAIDHRHDHLHRLQHVEHFAAADLADDYAVSAIRRCSSPVSLADFALTSTLAAAFRA